MILLLDSLLLFLSFDLAILLLILGLFLGSHYFVLLVLCLEPVLSGAVNISPHLTDDLGNFCDFGGRVIGLDAIVDFSSVEEESREGSLGGGGLSIEIRGTLSESCFLPIIYNLNSPIFINGLQKSYQQSLFNLIGPNPSMIQFFSAVEALAYSLIFIAAILLTQTIIDYQKILSTPHQSKIKIVVLLITTFSMTLSVYFTHCYDTIDFLECVYISPDDYLMRNIGIALFINTNLFLGGLHQWLYNGEIKKKFMRFTKTHFQWDLFKKLFIVPVCIEIVYRSLVCRILDPDFDHTSFFTFFSAILFSLSHFINYYKLNEKYGHQFAMKTSIIQAIYNLLFGLYISHIFSRQRALISSLVLHVYANFLGYPEYFEILKGNIGDDRVRKSAIFYLVGAIACLSCCLLM